MVKADTEEFRKKIKDAGWEITHESQKSMNITNGYYTRITKDERVLVGWGGTAHNSVAAAYIEILRTEGRKNA